MKKESTGSCLEYPLKIFDMMKFYLCVYNSPEHLLSRGLRFRGLRFRGLRSVVCVFEVCVFETPDRDHVKKAERMGRPEKTE